MARGERVWGQRGALAPAELYVGVFFLMSAAAVSLGMLCLL